MTYSSQRQQERLYSRSMDRLLEEARNGTKWARFLIKKEGYDTDEILGQDGGESKTIKSDTNYRPTMSIDSLSETEKEELVIKHNLF